MSVFISKIRIIQTLISILIFIIVFVFCWYETGFNLSDIQLSRWGVTKNASIYWNGTLMLLATSLFFNIDYYIKHHIRMINKKIIRVGFGSVFICLFLTGLIDMNYNIHNLTATYYFFMLPLVIYLTAYLNRKVIQYKEWLGHILFSISMIMLPLVFIDVFSGIAISEIAHSIVVIIWSIWVLRK